MTSPTSFVFYERSNPQHVREEGKKLVRLHITDTRMTLYLKEIIRTRKTRVLFEKVESQTTLSLHVNSKGQKYLKRFNKSQSGNIKDTSLCGDLASGAHVIDPGYQRIMKETLFGWFDMDVNRAVIGRLALEDVITNLLFPVVRAADFPGNSRTFKLLSEVQAMGYPVTRCLRESSTWEEFFYMLCPMVQTKEDVQFIKTYLQSLLHVAVLPVSDGLRAARAKYGTVGMFGFHHSFSVKDVTILGFAFKHLPQEEREALFDDIMALTHLHQMEKPDSASTTKTWSFNSPTIDFHAVPASQRGELAEYLRTYVGKLRGTMEADPYDERFQKPVIDTRLDTAVHYWYAKNIFHPRMTKTGTTVEDVRDHFFNLFHAEPWSEESKNYKVRVTETGELLFFAFSEISGGRLDEYPSSDLMLYMAALVGKQRSQVRGLHAYIEKETVKPAMSSEVYSADELIRLIDTAVEALDAELERLGRPVTPENRTAYLRFDRRERRFKNTWKYYDFGVRDIEKIIALKRGGVRAKADVMMYAGLPDAMFYEFLETAAGNELAAVGSRGGW